MPDCTLSIVIVNWNVKTYLEQCLAALPAAVGAQTYQVIVVDNASTDGSVEMVREKFPSVRLIASSENLGFGQGNEVGYRQSSGQYIAFLNPDTVADPCAFEGLVRFLQEHPAAGLVGPKSATPDGFVELPFLKPPSLRSAIGELPGVGALTRRFGKTRDTIPMHAPSLVFAPRGACMVFSRPALDAIGGFPRQTFMYGEELISGYRLKQKGYQVWFNPLCKITHFRNKSSEQRYLGMEAKLTITTSFVRAAAEMMPKSEYVAWNMVKATDAFGTSLYYTILNRPVRTYHLRVAKVHFAAAMGHARA